MISNKIEIYEEPVPPAKKLSYSAVTSDDKYENLLCLYLIWLNINSNSLFVKKSLLLMCP